MTIFLRGTLLLGLLLTGFTGATRAADDASGVRDGAGFFTPAAVRQAATDIAALKERYQVDLLIDSVASVPADKVRNVKAMTAAERTQFFTDWARERAQAAKVRGLIVLICKDPTYLRVEVGKQTQKQAFTLKDRDKLGDLLLARFKAKAYDQGLLDAVNFVRGRVESHLPPPLPRVVLNEVKDHAGFFTPATVQQANSDIRELKQQYGRDVVVETFKTLPADQARLIEGKDAATRNKVFTDWLAARASTAGVQGIFILICKEPAHIQIDVGQALRARVFPAADQDRLRDLLVARFKARDFDKGLLAALALVQETFDRTLSPSLKPLVARTVTDHGRFFSPTAVQQANAELRSIPPEPGKAVAIETFPTPPPGQTQRVENMTPAERRKYFAGWAQERASKGNLDGILVLICKRPASLRVQVNGSAANQRFPAADVEQLDKVLLARFRDKAYDQGLADAVRLLRTKLAPSAVAPVITKTPVTTKVVSAPPDTKAVPALVTPAKSSPDPSATTTASAAKKDAGTLAVAREKVKEAAQTTFPTWMWVVGIVGGLLVLWIVIRILRALFGAGKPSGYAEAPPPRPLPPAPASAPPQGQGGGYAQGPPGGYARGPQGGYQGPPPAAPVPQGGGGSGGAFVAGAVGGALAGAAGTLAAKAYFGRSGGPGSPPLASATPARPSGLSAPPPTSSPSSPSAGYGAGGDFGSGDLDRGTATGSASAGGDFGDASSVREDASAGGGDFGSPSGDASASAGGGDFGSDDTASGGGDFGSPSTDASGGGDFGSPSTDASGGGDFGSPSTDASGGGDFGSEPSGGGDSTTPEASGGNGDFGGGGTGTDGEATEGGKGGDF
jgi:uncharacterized membrane protein YgcG